MKLLKTILPASKFVHISIHEKFIPSLSNLLYENFTYSEHDIITFGDFIKFKYDDQGIIHNYASIKSLNAIFHIVRTTLFSKKIILHGLFMQPLVVLLCLMPWLHKKCVWVIWGGDLYSYRNKDSKNYYIFEFFRRILIRRIGGIATYIDGDYKYAQEWYGTKAKLYYCMMYSSNVFKPQSSNENKVQKKEDCKYNILVGNSADPSNNHYQIFDKLKELGCENINKIICPLSYGNKEYGEKTAKVGTELFGEKFLPLTDYMNPVDYQRLLVDVDIAVFAHDRQQAMGNTINLIGLGKTVYIKTNTTSYDTFSKLGIKVYDFSKLKIELACSDVIDKNIKNVLNNFCEYNLVQQYRKIFED